TWPSKASVPRSGGVLVSFMAVPPRGRRGRACAGRTAHRGRPGRRRGPDRGAAGWSRNRRDLQPWRPPYLCNCNGEATLTGRGAEARGRRAGGGAAGCPPPERRRGTRTPAPPVGIVSSPRRLKGLIEGQFGLGDQERHRLHRGSLDLQQF